LFDPSDLRWWQKPLVQTGGRHLPAELVILQLELRTGEAGAWLNSRGKKSGVVDLIQDQSGKFKTHRVRLPQFVTDRLLAAYARAGVAKGAPDLVIWSGAGANIRFVEVKCPDWDRPTADQLLYHEAVRALGSQCTIAEWRFKSRRAQL
jgi:hypothetical protein